MSDAGHMIWFVSTAVMIIVVLTVGTLAAAGLLVRGDDPEDTPTARQPGEER